MHKKERCLTLSLGDIQLKCGSLASTVKHSVDANFLHIFLYVKFLFPAYIQELRPILLSTLGCTGANKTQNGYCSKHWFSNGL